ncbi:hypothetical protein F503_04777 [Ophiostoma piceae UAMH 11346]|uniref:Uncharacterized protein n=1 Tax=Ophiostoma piceae (strain UAMH 11346) TaxID=1262450 RepID=S3BUV9_OPHP1|nr:hypothetical protein F503_04777 [Ophiostoma piceae UAMH 11346]
MKCCGVQMRGESGREWQETQNSRRLDLGDGQDNLDKARSCMRKPSGSCPTGHSSSRCSIFGNEASAIEAAHLFVLSSRRDDEVLRDGRSAVGEC